jgi:flagellar biosynthesis/type III secretory pathway chaperone
MSIALDRLAAILEQELTIAEELENNLAAQKQAIVDWNVEALLGQIAARESWLRLLGELEQKRSEFLNQSGMHRALTTLRQLLADLPPNGPEFKRMSDLQERTRAVFSRLQADQQNLHGVMSHISAHVQEALGALTRPALSLYGESGVVGIAPAASTLLQSRV